MRSARLGAAAALSFVLIGPVGVGCSQSPPGAGAVGSASAEGTTSTAAQPIQGGTLDGTAHPYALGVCIGGGPGNCQAFCSGALILPNVVVTARHCVDQTSHVIDCTTNPVFGGGNGPMWITTNSTMGPSSVWHSVSAVSVPTDNHVCGHDIALLVLSDLVPASEAKPITPGVQYPMTDIDRYPEHRVTAIGFGNTGPTGFTAGTRHIRTAIPLLCIPGDDFIPCPVDFNDNEFYTDDGTCEGDSGSSAYDDPSITKNAPLSFGVLSRGGDNAGDAGQPATLCKGGLYTRLDKYRDLIVNAADAASKNWTLYPKPVPDWTIFVPPAVDAGAPDASKKPAAQADGVGCSANTDCKSNVCADTGAGKACTEACDETVIPTTCQDGFVCKAAICVQDVGGTPVAAAPPAPGATTTTGCSVGAPGTSPGAPLRGPLPTLAIGAVAALILGTRRSRRNRADRA